MRPLVVGAKSSATARPGSAAPTATDAAKGVSAGREANNSTSRKDKTSVVGGETPRLVRTLGTHNIVFYKGLYYALPLALGDIDLTKEDVAGRPGVVVDAAEQAVLAEIELVAKWADSRGHFDAQEKQRAEGSYLKAGSALGEAEAAAIASKPMIVQFEGSDYAIERQELDLAFSDRAAIGAEGSREEDEISGPVVPRTIWHQAFNLLPPAARAEIRKAVIVERLSRAQGPEKTAPSGRDLAVAALRSLYRRTRTYGIASLFGDSGKQKGGQAISGTGIVIQSVASKDATPDLLRTIGNYNLVQFDGRFYGVPHGIYLDWNDLDPGTTPGMIVATTAKEATGLIEQAIGLVRKGTSAPSTETGTGPASEFFPEPTLLDTISDYNIVGYEGWVYGIPKAVGTIDLTEVDVTEMSGVIKDVSRDVVVAEIQFLAGQSGAAAAE